MTPIEWQENARFAPFARDLARRRRRPGLYPRATAAMASDALEQLCAGGTVIVPAASASVMEVDDERIEDGSLSVGSD